MPTVVIHFDGACEPVNPGGTGSWGWVVEAPPGEMLTGTGTIDPAPTTTNNLAEWYALGFALRAVSTQLAPLGADVDLLVRGDSQLVIRQLTGEWACRATNLIPLRARCWQLLDQIGVAWRAEWIPRDHNTQADALSVQAWEQATGRPFPIRQRKK